MGLSVRKLLFEYFSVYDLKDALFDIGEPMTGTKDELVDRLRYNWKTHNRRNYDLLDYLEKDALLLICQHYNLDVTPANEDALRRRIKKARLLDSNSYKRKNGSSLESGHKPFGDVHFNIGTIKISKNSKIGIVAGIITTAATIIGVVLSLN
ncbi:MAG: hypothetical protein GWN01_10240 [Nitrosopumilaceae archaeon]|nr:hypothetical protein [Nitrosopumilaceae archaeon]NIU01280.1 hypothetical protein [Nitrosopumilaceae archaeon]NIU87628.1 hypothetical protein [Nitrosopumilaceae archaeon]NIV66053.1 hypothetical protein [Nitrosopumilaceae archaeon]NIX61882.1 hypothetical protein [Nitrosopumilaceae archaeon]